MNRSNKQLFVVGISSLLATMLISGCTHNSMDTSLPNPNSTKNMCSNVNSKNETVFCQDFEQSPLGNYTHTQLQKDWKSLIPISKANSSNPQYSWGIKEKRVKVVQDSSANRWLEVSYPKGEYNTNKTGATWRVQLPKQYDSLSLSYDMKFLGNFQFYPNGSTSSGKLIGGKLPGLAGGNANSGGEDSLPNGRDGWSARLMWGEEGRGLNYVYYPDMGGSGSWAKYRSQYFVNTNPTSCWPTHPNPSENGFRFVPQKVYHITSKVKMNTPTGTDGSIETWINGKLVVSCSGMRFRDVESLAIDQLFFSTFLGGGKTHSIHSRDELIWFDNFIVKEE